MRMHTGNEVETQARQLSSGTIATLTGWKDYYSLDIIQNKFIEFIQENLGKFENWQTAWNEFVKP